MTASKSQDSAISSASLEHSEQTDFVLKHRVAGAAFLLVFGALFLPWLLGAPDAATVAEQAPPGPVETVASNDKVVDDELLLAIAGEGSATQEQVYISKITPLDASRESASSAQGSPPANSVANNTKPDSKPADKPATQLVDKPAGEPVVKAETLPQAAKTAAPKEVAEQAAAAPPQTERAEQQAANKVAQPPSSETDVDVGWVVQVGVFTDKKGASRVVEDLKSKGFSPSTTIVDTNRGKATGTRIWLGPFAQRVDAAKAKSSLTAKTGEAGFIRSFP